ncbi:MAG TPA: cupredoxin domain-containing protein [Actinomycetota bacterium]|nr:cupredoxin domain-containing protein [Actinomycetota bacterium]
MQRIKLAFPLLAILLSLPACGNDATGALVEGSRARSGNMGVTPPQAGTSLLGPEAFPCRPGTGDQGYWRYGVGRMRRGGWEVEELEPDHIVLAGAPINLHGTARVADGGSIEVEMYEDYFEPSVLEGPPGGRVIIELHNEGTRPHNFSVPAQGIDLQCGVRARAEVEVVFPRSGLLLFSCTYTATSGMRGALILEE